MKPTLIQALESTHAAHAREYSRNIGTLSVLSQDALYWKTAQEMIAHESNVRTVINWCVQKYDNVPMCRHALQDIHYLVENWGRITRKMEGR